MNWLGVNICVSTTSVEETSCNKKCDLDWNLGKSGRRRAPECTLSVEKRKMFP